MHFVSSLSIVFLPSFGTIGLTFFFFNDTATTEIYTLSLHDALPIYEAVARARHAEEQRDGAASGLESERAALRSEEHTSELQSQSNLVCRLLLEKKKTAASTLDGAAWSHRRTSIARSTPPEYHIPTP